MISINVKFMDGDIKSLVVSGHANYAKLGKDIVCAGVSAILTGGINALENYVNSKDVNLINKDGSLGVEIINSNEKIQTILNTIYIQLKTIEEAYKDFVKINK